MGEETKIPALIVDLDGTLVDVSGIRYLVESSSRDFEQFHRASIDCPPIQETLGYLAMYRSQGLRVLIVSARSEKYLALTNMWLALHDIQCDDLLMRNSRDSRPDIEVKTAMYHRLATKYKILVAIDDRADLISNWSDLGIPVTHFIEAPPEIVL